MIIKIVILIIVIVTINYKHIQASSSFWAWLPHFLHLSRLRISPPSGPFSLHHDEPWPMIMILPQESLTVIFRQIQSDFPQDSKWFFHQDDLAAWVSWLRYPSPQYWASHPILERELAPVINIMMLSINSNQVLINHRNNLDHINQSINQPWEEFHPEHKAFFREPSL